MQEYEKVISLFEYTKKLVELKYNIVSDIAKQLFSLPIKSIPAYEQYTEVSYRDFIEVHDNAISSETEPLLRIQKPEFQPCPEPSDEIRLWLNEDWQNFRSDGDNIAERKMDEKFTDDHDRVTAYRAWIQKRKRWTSYDQSTEGKEACPEPDAVFVDWLKDAWQDSLSEVTVFDIKPVTERFIDNKSRVDLYEKWYAKREEWAVRQRKIDSVRSLFMRLFNVYTDLSRESETQEFMVGNGSIRIKNDSHINHPLLLKRVSIDLNAKDNIITINDTDSVPEIYALLLSEISKTININAGIIIDAQTDLTEKLYHPLDRNNTSVFLKTFMQSLSSDSDFVAYDEESKHINSGIQISMNEPVFFVRKKIDGTLKALEIVIDTINETHEYPRPLGELVSGGKIVVPERSEESSIEELLAYANGENPDILLSKEANREQLEIAERIEHYNAVLVQGPPGTGKTHTIANLIGHFLSQGKNVLVTSHTAKALSVIQEKLPESICSLCVTVTGDDNSAMIRSVDGISEFMAHNTSDEMVQRVKSSQEMRTRVREELNTIRKKLYQIRYSEFEPIVFCGKGYSPKEVAEFVHQNSETLSYIPGKVELYHALPVTLEDLLFLYKCNDTLSQSEEAELSLELPNPATLPSVQAFKELFEEFKYANSGTPVPPYVPELIDTPNSSQVEYISSTYIKPLSMVGNWASLAAADGKRGGGYRQMWENLCDLIKEAADCSEENALLLRGKNVDINNSVTLSMIQNNGDKLQSMYSKGKPSALNMAFYKEVKIIANGVKINGQPLTTEQDCRIILAYARLEQLRDTITPLWDDLLAQNGERAFHALGNEPELIAMHFVEDIKVYLDWNKDSLEPLQTAIIETGLSFDAIFSLDRFASDREQFTAMFNIIIQKLPALLQAICEYDEYNKTISEKTRILEETFAKQESICSVLTSPDLANSSICKNLVQSIETLNTSLYSEMYGKLCTLYEKYELINRRQEILNRIREVAPVWATAVELRQGIHGEPLCPENIDDAWKWKQFAGIIDELTDQPFEELQQKNARLSIKLREITADLVTNKAWLHLLRTTESDLSMRQALQGWKMTVQKIGKGTGKNAPMYRREATRLMSQCQKAVPAWVMPIGKALDMLNPAVNKFDVIIVDEASQCDLSSLGVLYMGKKIIIVGDDKQVSPLAVGIDTDRINYLRDTYIKDKIPNSHLYDPKFSLYDIAKTTFQALMLREHFRCLPEIIGYSNKLCYDYKIKPLRDTGTAKLLPPVVNYRITGGMRDGRRKSNHKEAEYIVATILACLDQPEYDGMSFGVISLLGDEQAALIQTKVLEKISAQVIEERRILCGNASHFQGDERDVIFLSLVDSNEGDGPLRLTGEGVEASTRQRYNVAASRAKEQLWVVHSLDCTKDLKTGDMRRDLIEYANNPNVFLQVADSVTSESESPFEEAVGKTLVAAGYQLEQQYPVGAYRLDMAISYGEKKIALECDGEAWHSSVSQIMADMERQAILERIGWHFIRIRGSEYYRSPEKAMTHVMEELTEFGIIPQNSGIDEPAEQITSDLLERIKIRTNQIIDDECDNINLDVVFDTSGGEKNTEATKMSPIDKYADTSPQTIKVILSPTIEKTIELPLHAGDASMGLPKIEENVTLPSNRTTEINRQLDGADAKSPFLNRTLFSQLDEMGIEYKDNREKGIFLWIIDSTSDHSSIENILQSSGMEYCFERRGSVATNDKPAWRAK